MATFNLEKGASFNLEKSIETVHCGLFWEPPKGGPKIDLDVHCFGLGHNNGDSSQPYLVEEGAYALTYAFMRGSRNPEGSMIRNPDGTFQSVDGAMVHKGDDRTGRGRARDGDEHGMTSATEDEEYREETMIVLARLPEEIVEIAVWATIHDGGRKGQHFGLLGEAGIEVCDAEDIEVCRYTLSAEFSRKTAVQIASFLRQKDGSWDFQAIGAGSDAGLGDIINAYMV